MLECDRESRVSQRDGWNFKKLSQMKLLENCKDTIMGEGKHCIVRMILRKSKERMHNIFEVMTCRNLILYGNKI